MTTGLISTTPRRVIPEILDDLAGGDSVMLWGPAGCAKSAIALKIANDHYDGHLIDCRLATHDPADFHLPVPNIERQVVEWWVTEILPNIELHGERGILLLDELSSAAPAQAIVGYQLALDRALGRYQIPQKWGIIAAGNRLGDRGIAYAMASPLANRFEHYELDPSTENKDLNLEWVSDFCYDHAENDRNPLVSAFIQSCPDMLYRSPKQGQVSFPTLRSWTKLSYAVDRAEQREQRISRTKCIGRVGIEAAEKFLTFVAHKDEVPTYEEICINPTTARCPSAKNLGACFYVVGQLCYKVTATTFPAVSKYLARLPDEIDAAAVGMMSEKKKAEILGSKAGSAWLQRVHQLIT